MLSVDQQEEFNRRFEVLRTLALSMAGGVFLCVIIVGLILRLAAAARGVLPVDHTPENLRQAFYLMTLLAGIAAFGVRGQMLSNEALQVVASRGFAALMVSIQTRTIVLLALCEGVAFLGLILFIFSQRLSDLTTFACVSLSGFLWLWPRRSIWESRVASLFDAP